MRKRARGAVANREESFGDFFGYLRNHKRDLLQAQIGEWKTAVQFLMSLHPIQVVHAQRVSPSHAFDVALHKDGTISGSCRDSLSQEVFHVELDSGIVTDSYGGYCECDTSQTKSPCRHTMSVCRYVLGQLEHSHSQLVEQIRAGYPGIPKKDYAELVLRQLDSFLGQQQEFQSATEVLPPTRIIWHVRLQGSITLEILKQKPLKRGGWSKGQVVDPERLLSKRDDVPLTPADNQTLQAFHSRPYSGYGYRAPYELNYIEALQSLAGCDRVWLNEQPGKIEVLPFGLRLEQSPDGFRFRPASYEPGLKKWIFPGGVILYIQDSNLLRLMTCNKAQADLAKSLLDEKVVIPLDRVDALRDRLGAMAKYVTLELPEQLAGPIIPVESDAVALLRSCDTGALEVSLRMRDPQQRRHAPGEGIVLLPGEQDGKPVQYRRDFEQEQQRASRLATELRLRVEDTISSWTWRLTDFAAGLQLLEDLERRGEELQIQIVWDPNTVRTVSMMGSLSPRNVRVEVSRKKDWFGVEGSCRIGEHEIPLVDLLNAMQQQPVDGGFLEIQPGQWAKISSELRDRLRKLHDNLHQNRRSLEFDMTALPVLREFENSEIDFQATKIWHDSVARMESAQAIDPEPSAEFKATLRDYQLQGYKWMRRLAEWGVGGCLADDMGLGKTVQALAVLVDRAPAGPALVIAPTSVGFNWQREAGRFAPTLRTEQYRETSRQEFLKEVGPGDLVICSYGLALRDADALSQVAWGSLILDEAQNIKNTQSKTARAIRNIPAAWKVALTGTPMENHLGELWSLFRTVSPGLFGSWDRFRQRFAAPIERDQDDERRRALSQVIKPFVLRRTKSDVLKDLPQRTEQNLYVDLSPAERRRYDEMRLAALGELDEIVGLPATQDQRFRILAIMTRLRQMACHLGLVDSAWEGTSAKLDLLLETLDELRSEGHRTLIFSQFTQYLGLIRRALDAAGVKYEYLDGSTSPKNRQEAVDRFQNGNADAFLISLKAGGTGLNLTGADYVIHMDPWWNPAVEDQATDRAHRLGQTRPVMVYRILARNTIEEQILSLHGDKRNLVASIMEGTSSAGSLSTSDLIDLIRGNAS